MALNSSSAPAPPELAGLGETELLQVIRSHPLPAHVAIIMDGNGRWPRDAGFPASPVIVRGSRPRAPSFGPRRSSGCVT